MSRSQLSAIAIALLLSCASALHAATFTVDTTADDPAKTACDDATADDCSLRGAVIAASALTDASTINVPAGTYPVTQSVTCTRKTQAGGTQQTTQAALCLTNEVTIQGAGAATTVIDGLGLRRPVLVSFGANAELRGVTVTHGLGEQQLAGGGVDGGAIRSFGTLRLTDSVVSNSTLPPGFGGATGAGIYNGGALTLLRTTVTQNVSLTSDVGGGIYNDGFQGAVLTVIDSLISDNTIGSSGGGIANAQGGVVTITGSTIAGNTANGASGGGISSGSFTTLKLTNSTISGNQSGSSGGGVAQRGATELTNVTITANTSGQAGGFDNSLGGSFIMRNTILAGNAALAGNPLKPDCDARTSFTSALISQGHNLIGNTSGCDITGDTTSNITNADAKLGILTDNGGPTPTHGLAADSPAVNAGNPAQPGSGGTACATADQRALLRPLGAACDIGAFERNGAFVLTKILPQAGGSGESLLVHLAGDGFRPETTVALRRAGHADIAGSPVTIDTGGAALTTIFDLTSAEVGTWDVVVANPGPVEVSLPATFTVEPPRDPDLFAIVVGRNGARPGLAARFEVLYGNRGNTDALAVPITLGLPAAFARSLAFEVAPPPEQPGQPYNDYRNVPLTVTPDVASEQLDIPLLIPIVPAGFTGLLVFTLTPPPNTTATEFGIQAFIGAPWFAHGTVRPEIVAEAATRARQTAADRLGVTVGPEIDPTLIAYETNALGLAITSARAELVGNFGQSRRVFSLAYFAIDLAGYAAQEAMASAAPVSRFATIPQRLAQLLDLVASTVEAEIICPPCICGAIIAEGCSCDPGGCIHPGDPGPPAPKPPPDGLTPAECRDLPKHKVSADGKTCQPTGTKDCPLIPGFAFTTNPDCTTYPIKGSYDPNDKVGSGGSGPERFVTAGTPMPYAIAFENLPAATAPAQTVVVTDQLDTQTLDLESFSLGPILIGDIGILPPPGVTAFSGGADLRPAHQVIVRVDAGLDKATGIVTWEFTSLDPLTMEALTDADEGFLPPNVVPPEGDGLVHFTILPKAGLSTGTEIRNHARIVFDTNAPIDTPEWLNTIDASVPASKVDGIDPPDCTATDLTVHWSGTDAGSGIAGYAVFVSTDGGPFESFIADTAETSAAFPGETGRRYAFYTVARDGAGNVEAAPATPDVLRTVGGCDGNDFAVVQIKAPKRVALDAKHPTRSVRVGVQIQNRSLQPKTVPDAAVLANLVHLAVESLGQSCTAPAAPIHVGKPQLKLPVTLKSKKKVTVVFDVTIDCANDPLKTSKKSPGHEDYALRATVDHNALGSGDAHPADDACPRQVTPPGVLDPFPNGKLLDKGCGGKKSDKTLGAPVTVDVVVAGPR